MIREQLYPRSFSSSSSFWTRSVTSASPALCHRTCESGGAPLASQETTITLSPGLKQHTCLSLYSACWCALPLPRGRCGSSADHHAPGRAGLGWAIRWCVCNRAGSQLQQGTPESWSLGGDQGASSQAPFQNSGPLSLQGPPLSLRRQNPPGGAWPAPLWVWGSAHPTSGALIP